RLGLPCGLPGKRKRMGMVDVFRPLIKGKKAAHYYGKVRDPKAKKGRKVSLGVTAKQVARQKLRELQVRTERGAYGMLDPLENTPLLVQVADFMRHLEQQGRCAAYRLLDLPRNGGHPVKSVNSLLGGPTWQERDAPTPPSSRPRRSSSSPTRATPSPRRPAPSASTKPSSAPGNRRSKPRASRPSPATASSPPSRRNFALCGP